MSIGKGLLCFVPIETMGSFDEGKEGERRKGVIGEREEKKGVIGERERERE
jgi:hypothetical protein